MKTRLYRTLNLSNQEVLYVDTTSLAAARSYAARKIVQVERATALQMSDDVIAGKTINVVKPGVEHEPAAA
jgi:hypothetical protein